MEADIKTKLLHLLVALAIAVSLFSGALPVSAATPPMVTTNAATSVTFNSVTLNGNLDSLGTATTVNLSFEYGTTNSYGSLTDTQSVTGIGAFTARITGLSPNTNYYFRARADGGAEGADVGVDMTFTTKTPPTVSTNEPFNISTNSVTLNGNLDNLGTATTVFVTFEYGTTTGYGSTTPVQPRTATGTFTAIFGTLTGQIPGLIPGTTYHFRAKATSGESPVIVHGTSYGVDKVFTTLTPVAPTVATNAASPPTINSVILNGNLTSLGTASSVDVSFEYGTTIVYGSTVPANPSAMTATGAFTASISGLSTGTLYHFRAKVDGGVVHGTATGIDMTITTLVPIAPTVTTNAANPPTVSSVTLNGSLDNLGTGTTVNVSFDYGTTIAYGSITAPQPMTSVGLFNSDIANLDPSTTYHFRAKADAGANGMALGLDNTFTTGAPTSSVVITSPAINVTSSSVTLNGILGSLGTAPSVSVSFEYGLTNAYGSSTSVQVMTVTGPITASVTGLSTGTLYYFRAVANGGLHGVSTGVDMTFTTLIPPAVTTSAATSVTINTAVLNGNLTSLGTAGTVNVSFEYGTTIAYGSTTAPQPMTATGAFAASIAGLNTGTLYHFRAKTDGGAHGIIYGSDFTFTTMTPVPPVVATSPATSVTSSSAALNGNLTSLGTASPVNVFFEYGATTSYEKGSTPVQPMTATGAFTASITGLSPGTLYHFRTRADGLAHGAALGADLTFTTLTTPAVTTGAATGITSSGATLNGNLTSLGTAVTVDVSFEYGTTIVYGSTTIAQAMIAAGPFTAGITGLSPGTLYHFRAKVDGGLSGSSTGSDMTFTTIRDPPVVSTTPATGVTDTAATLNGNLTSLGTASPVNVTFEYGTTTSYEKGSTPVQPMTATGVFTAPITGLNPGTLYHFRARADGLAHGAALGADITFTTLTTPVVTTGAATGITSSGATLNGNLTSLGAAVTVNVSFEYGTTIAYGSTAPLLPQAMTTTGVFTANITGLTPSTLYHFRAKADGGVHGTANGLDATFTTLAAGGVPAGPGGGGGGGGGGGASLAMGFTGKNGYRTSGSINALGVVQGNINGYSTDGVLMLALPAGTYALDRNGRPLSGFSMAPEETLPAPANGTGFLGTVYNCQPDGATFSPPVVLTWNYNPDELPKGVSENGLSIGYWDENAGRWVTLKGIVVDTELHNLSVLVSHFTTFAVFYKIPVVLEYSPLKIVPAEAVAGQNVNISVTVSNTGGAAGSSKLVLLINGIEEAMKEETLAAGESKEVSFSVARRTPGIYRVEVNGIAGSFVISAPAPSPVAPSPASLAILNLSISPETVRSGENVTISVVVANTGGTAGPYSVVLAINGVMEGRKEATVLPGKTQKIDFDVVKKNPGTYQVEVNTFVSSFIVEKKASIDWWWFALAAVVAGAVGIALYLLARKPKREQSAIPASYTPDRKESEIVLGTPEEYDAAILDRTRAIERNPDSSSAHHERGVLFFRKGAYDDAIRDYTQAIKLNPGTPFVYRDRGVAYSRKGDYTQALADLSMGLRIFPGDTEAYYERGMVYKSLGQKFLATADFNTVITLRPDSPFRKKTEQALEELQRSG